MSIIVPPKPSTAYWIPGDQLASSGRALVPLCEGTGTPSEIRTATAGSWVANGGTSTAAWGSDPLGAYLNFDDGSATNTASPFEELHLASLGAPNTTSGSATLFAYLTLSSNYYSGSYAALGTLTSGSGQEVSLALGGGASPCFGMIWGAALHRGTTQINLTLGHTYAVVLTCDSASNSNCTLQAYDYTAGTTLTDSGFVLGGKWNYIGSSSYDFQINARAASSTGGIRGRMRLAGWSQAAWNGTQIAAFFADPFEAARATLTPTPSSVVAGTGGQSIALLSNTAAYTAGTPGTPTISLDATLSSGTTKTSQAVADASDATVVVGVGSAGSFTLGDGRATATVTVSGSPATAVALSGPSTTASNATSSAFTASISGTSAGVTITPTSTVGTDVFVPTSLTLNSATQSGTFTVTTPYAGSRSIGVTNGGGLTNPSPVTLVASASTLTAGTVAGTGAGTYQKIDSVALAEATAAGGGQGPYTYSWSQGFAATAAYASAIPGKASTSLTLTGQPRRVARSG